MGAPRVEPWSYAYLLGLYLGDGHITQFPRAACLSVYLDAAYPGIVDDCVRAMRTVRPTNSVRAYRPGSGNCVRVFCYSQQWPILIPQHGPGPKHERPIRLASWQREITSSHAEAFVRGLIHSDGCRFLNRVRRRDRWYAYPRYQFTNASDDIRGLFCEHLDLLGIDWRPMTARVVSVARRGSVARLDEFVGPKS